VTGVYLHEPGRLSRWGVVDVGLKCVHSCRHCFYSYLDGSKDQFAGMRRAAWHALDNLLELVEGLAEHSFLGFDVTGGEPTAHPGIVDIVARAARCGIASRIITLGQFLTRRGLLDRLLDAGLTDFRFSLHSTDAEVFKAMTGGELKRLVAAMDELQRRGFQYVTNTTITERNYTDLPAIAHWIAARPEIYQTTWLFFMPYYQWAQEEHAGDHRVAYSEIAPYLRDAVAIVEAAGIGATIRYAPQCTIRGMEKNHVGIVGVRHDPHEWMNAIDHTADPAMTTPATMRAMGEPLRLNRFATNYPLSFLGRGEPLVAMRAGGSKVFPAKCRDCRAIAVCDGIDLNYLEQRGDSELEPYSEFRGDLIDRARLRYRAAHVIKTAPGADARAVVRSLLAQ
jgi:molybdenum cofactor biosynthesis enzyme MoaA